MNSTIDHKLLELAKKKIDAKTKPLGSLGVLEDIAVRLAGIQETLEPKIIRKRVLIYAASHGIAQEGVSAYPTEVTGQMVLNFLNGGAAINVLAKHGQVEIHVVDVGVDTDFSKLLTKNSSFYQRSVRGGTRNFLKEPAMTYAECQQAITVGKEQVQLAKKDQIHLLGIGEMGIGNTTSASALFAAILQLDSQEVVGRGTGINDSILKHKAAVIQKSLGLHGDKIEKPEAFYWLSVVGGFEIAAMVGTILEAAKHRLAVVIDGFIATSAAAVAFALEPHTRDYCFFSHCSNEQAHSKILKKLGVEPLLDLKMRLGEGTGAVLGMHFIEASSKILCEMATFESAKVSGLKTLPIKL